jgi:hypothetical protein
VAPGDEVLRLVESAYREHFEVQPARASVSFVGVELIEVLRFADGANDHYLTLGMSRRPMSDGATSVVEDWEGSRAELLTTASSRPAGLWKRLAVLAASPVVQGAVYQPGGRIDLGEALVAGSRCSGVVLAPSPLKPIPVPGASAVVILQALPATANELAWARVHGSDALIDRWRELDVDLADLARLEMPLRD